MSMSVGALIVASFYHSLWHEINILARPNHYVVGAVGVF